MATVTYMGRPAAFEGKLSSKPESAAEASFALTVSSVIVLASSTGTDIAQVLIDLREFFESCTEVQS